MNVRTKAPRAVPVVLLSLALLTIFVAGYVLGGAASKGPSPIQAGPAQADNAEAFWGRLRPAGFEVDRFATLAEMVAASDAVVVAKVFDVQMSRTVHGDSEGDVVAYASVVLRVERVIAGQVPASVPVEFMVGATADQAPPEIALLKQAIPTGSSVFFLHAKLGDGEKGLFRIINSTGLWATTSRAQLDAPLQEFAPGESGLYAAEIRGFSTLAGFTDLLTSYVTKS